MAMTAIISLGCPCSLFLLRNEDGRTERNRLRSGVVRAGPVSSFSFVSRGKNCAILFCLIGSSLNSLTDRRRYAHNNTYCSAGGKRGGGSYPTAIITHIKRVALILPVMYAHISLSFPYSLYDGPSGFVSAIVAKSSSSNGREKGAN